MNRAALKLIFFTILLPVISTEGRAADCTGLAIGNLCLFGKQPENHALDPGDKDQLLKISQPKGARPQNRDELYKVNLTCDRVKSPKLMDWGPFVETSVATSHIVALTSTKLSSTQLPTDAKAAVTVFSVSGDRKSRSVVQNDNCSASFAISGRDKLFVSAIANKTSTNEPGPLASVVSSLIQVALPILPLFTGVGAATDILKGVSQTSDPLTKLYSQLDKGNTVTQSMQLVQGNNIVLTPYSKVTVAVSKIKSVIQDPDLIDPYETIVKDAYTSLKLDDKQPTDLAQGCRRFDALMRDRNLSPDDISYGLVLLTRLSGFDRTKTLTCMGPEFALTGLKHTTLWKRFMDKPNYDEDAARAAFLADSVAPKPPHKDFADVKTTLQFAMSTLGGYTRSRGQVQDGIDKYYADEIHVVNAPDTPIDGHTEGAVWSRDDFLKKFIKDEESSVFRVACLASDTEADALFLVFSAKPPMQSTFADDDAMTLQVWINGDRKIGWVKIDQSLDLVEKAIPVTRSCNKTVNIKPLAKPGS